jgi:hypothetical protein
LSGRRLVGRKHGSDDGRRLAEIHHGEHPDASVFAEEAFAARARIWPPLVWAAYGPVDQRQISDGGVLLEDLRLDDREEHDLDAPRRLRAKHDLHGAILSRAADAKETVAAVQRISSPACPTGRLA